MRLSVHIPGLVQGAAQLGQGTEAGEADTGSSQSEDDPPQLAPELLGLSPSGTSPVCWIFCVPGSARRLWAPNFLPFS